jgi:hypothetical protein
VEAVTRGQKQLHSEKYYYGNKIQDYEMAWHEAPMGGTNPEGKRVLGISSRGREDNNKTDLKETRFGGVDWVHVAKSLIMGIFEDSNETLGFLRGEAFLISSLDDRLLASQ